MRMQVAFQGDEVFDVGYTDFLSVPVGHVFRHGMEVVVRFLCRQGVEKEQASGEKKDRFHAYLIEGLIVDSVM